VGEISDGARGAALDSEGRRRFSWKLATMVYGGRRTPIFLGSCIMSVSPPLLKQNSTAAYGSLKRKGKVFCFLLSFDLF
jgi:hypothetical protein